MASPAATDAGDALSETQVRLLGLLAGRRTNAQISRELGISTATVKWNVSQVLSKLGLGTRTEAADWWRARHGVPTVLRGPRTTKEHPMHTPVISRAGTNEAFEAAGESLAIQEWRGSAPGELHVHHNADIAWHVLEGTLRFRFESSETSIGPGETLFCPAGTSHTYGEGDTARYLVIAPPRLFDLFLELRTARTGRPHTDWGNAPDPDIYRKHDSELLETPAS